jgi:hypothetical protein
MTVRIQPSPFLRNALRADALISAAAGAVMVFGADALAPLTGLPGTLLLAAGLSMLPFVAFVAWLSGRPSVTARMVWAVIVLNLLWAVDCAWVAFGAGLSPTLLGFGFVGVQIATVLLLAELEFTGLRRAAAAQA